MLEVCEQSLWLDLRYAQVHGGRVGDGKDPFFACDVPLRLHRYQLVTQTALARGGREEATCLRARYWQHSKVTLHLS